jgi:hypothetical protein
MVCSVFCDFCKQMRSQQASVSMTKHRQQPGHKHISDVEECQCDEMQPGLYDIETEMCTPEIDDVKEYIPAEIQNDILEKRPVLLFYNDLYDIMSRLMITCRSRCSSPW